MNALESHIERESCRIYRELGAVATVKVGMDGWPDRLVVLENGRVFWVEFKALHGRLRAAQERRIHHLRKSGHVVFVPRRIEDAALDFADAVVRLLAP